MLYQDILKEAKNRLEKSVKSIKQYFASHISLRINPEILSSITVEYNDSILSIPQIAQVNVDNQTTLSIKPWDAKVLPKIEKALIDANSLKLNISVAANNVIYVKLPLTTKERRQELIKLAKQQGENAKISVRNIRQEFKTIIKATTKDEALSKDEEKYLEDKLQALIDDCNKELENLVKMKQEELSKI